MGTLRPALVVAACTALSCARAPQASSPAPATGASVTAARANAAPAGDSIIQRVLYSTTTNVQGSAPGRVVGPRARMQPTVMPPRALLADSMFTVSVTVGTDGKAKLETLKLHDGATEAQRAAAREWLAAGRFTLPQRDGAPAEAPFEVRGRAAAIAPFAAGAASGADASGALQRMMMPRRRGELSGQQLLAIAPRVARIVSDLDTLRVRPGMQVMFANTLQIGVLDSVGTFLGYLPRYDSSIRVEMMDIDGRSITASAEGVAMLRLSWPRSMWQGRSDSAPSLLLPVLSSRRATDAQLAAQRLSTGAGTNQCSTGSSEIECNFIEVRSSENDRESVGMTRIRTLVLQRGLPSEARGARGGDTASFREQLRRMRAVQTAMEERDRNFIGRIAADGRPVGYEMGRFNLDTVYVGDRAFAPSWRRDSALVILLDHSRPGGPEVTTLMIPSSAPDGVTTKNWRSGDTLFTVMPNDPQSKWRTFFARFPAIAEFLRP